MQGIEAILVLYGGSFVYWILWGSVWFLHATGFYLPSRFAIAQFCLIAVLGGARVGWQEALHI